MIEINFYNNGFICSGHANYAKYNSDIVCAGVSAIVIGALNWFDEKTTSISVYENEIKVMGLGIDFQQKLDLIFIQLQALVHQRYEKYVRLHKISSELR